MKSLDPEKLIEWIHTYKRQAEEVQELMLLAPNSPEFPDLLSTVHQAIDTAEAELEGPPEPWAPGPEHPFTVTYEPIPMDLPSFSPSKVAQHITAVQQRAAVLGWGPREWAVSAKCHARAGPDGQWRAAVIAGISQDGAFMVEWQPASEETCSEVDASDLKLIPPAAGAFWTPKEPPPYDPTLPNYPVVYTEQEKDTQREAYERHHQGLKDAIAGGKPGYTFPPGVYRSREKMRIEGSKDFTLTLANVEWVSEADSFLFLGGNTNLTIRGPLILDAEPFRLSQCRVTGSDGETYLDLQVMPGYADPGEGKFLIFNPQGISFPTGQVTPKGSPAARGGGRFRMEFDEYYRHVLAIPGLAKAGNFLTMLDGPGGIQLYYNKGVTLEHFTTFCGGAVTGTEGDSVDRFYNLRALRRPGTNRLFAGGKFYWMWLQGGSFIMDRCEVAYNDDDLSDVFSYIGYTIENAHGSDSAIFALSPPWEPDQELRIYDGRTLKTVGRACIKSITPCKDAAALEALNCAFRSVGMREKDDGDLRLIELDAPVSISSLCLIDCKQGNAQKMIVTNCHFHDGLNCGIDCKGGQEILIANNVVQRTRMAGVNAVEDTWWAEGGMAGQVMMRNNTVHDAYYQYGPEGLLTGPSITSYARAVDEHLNPQGCPVESVRVVGNLAVDPHGEPISVTQCADVVICGNLPADLLPSDAPDQCKVENMVQ